MNTLENRVQSDLLLAMKDKNTVQMSALRSIKTAIMETRTAPGGKKDLDDSDILKIIKKLAKQREESAQIYRENNRPELAENESAELEVLNSYLPKMLSESEIETIVEKTISDMGASSIKDMGKVMGFINKTYAGQVDGKTVSDIVRTKLS